VEVIHDHVVVGSGITGAQAAHALIEGGARVVMLDGGFKDETYADLISPQDHLTLRAGDPEQHRWLLGDRYEGVPWGEAAHTLTPPRQHIVRETERWLPAQGDFQRMESLAYGGLGAGWGAGSAVYTRAELERAGLDPDRIAPAYEVVGRRIGLSAERDDATPYCAQGLVTLQPPLKMDESIVALRAVYERKRAAFRARGIVMGKVPMAVLTQPLGGRGANPYTDMEFWADHARSVYRPWMTVEALRSRESFEYRPGRFVTRFEELADRVVVHVKRLDGAPDERVLARRLVLGTGALGSARIVMRSQPALEQVPLLTNAYCIAPCLHVRRLGRPLGRSRSSLGQLEMYLDPHGDGRDVRMVSLYTYRSLLLFKLVKEMPLALGDGLKLMRALAPSLVLATINHPDRMEPGKGARRVRDEASPTGDALRFEYRRTDAELREDDACERRITAAMGALGAPALKRQVMKSGATVHYAGTIPYGDGEAPGTLAADGRLAGTRRVYLADGSGFRYLPGNGLTFTLMAWAHTVGRDLAARRTDA
jgi:choline dehydrogenase-like flavoprotein